MYIRVVRFADIDPERIDELLSRVEESGPPADIPLKGFRLCVDQGQRTAVALQYFETAEDMEVGARTFDAMDPSETPGTRVSVDMCEVKLERMRA